MEWEEIQQNKINELKLDLKRAKNWEWLFYVAMVALFFDFYFGYTANLEYQKDIENLQTTNTMLEQKLKTYEDATGK